MGVFPFVVDSAGITRPAAIGLLVCALARPASDNERISGRGGFDQAQGHFFFLAAGPALERLRPEDVKPVAVRLGTVDDLDPSRVPAASAAAKVSSARAARIRA